MDSKELIVLAILGAFFVFGVGCFVAGPIVTRKFYRQHGFSDQGPSELETPAESILLGTLGTKKLFAGEYGGYSMLHASGRLRRTSFLTFSKAKRKLLQRRWSVTQLEVRQPLPEFLLLPKSDPGTILLMMSEEGVDLSSYETLDHRYFLRSQQPEPVVSLLAENLHEFLHDRQFASIEVIGKWIVVKRDWPSEKVEHSLQSEFDCAVAIANYYCVSTSQ